MVFVGAGGEEGDVGGGHGGCRGHSLDRVVRGHSLDRVVGSGRFQVRVRVPFHPPQLFEWLG